MYKETNGVEWVNTQLYKSKTTFVCVSVDQALISNEKNIKNLKLSDFLCKERFHHFNKHQILNFPFLIRNHVFIVTFRNHMLSENSVLQMYSKKLSE